MPPKTKRRQQSAKAAAAGRESQKKKRESLDQQPSTSQDQDPTVSGAAPTQSSSADTVSASTAPQTSATEASGSSQADISPPPRTQHEILKDFSDEWIVSLDRDDKKSLAMFLCHNLAAHFHLKDTEAAEVTAAMVGKSDRTVRQWQTDMVSNNGVIPESKQGRYQRSGVLWNNEELNKLAADYVQNNSSVKGKPNMTTFDFCKWVNKTLLPNSTLEPGFPRKVSVSTCQRWLHHLGFEVVTPRRGIYYDRHEREDVVEYRKEYLRKMVKIGFIHFTNAPTESAKLAIPTDIDPPTLEKRSKTVVFFHDESTSKSEVGCQRRENDQA